MLNFLSLLWQWGLFFPPFQARTALSDYMFGLEIQLPLFLIFSEKPERSFPSLSKHLFGKHL